MNDSGDTSGYIQYKAIYDFDSRNPDELPFKAGDIIMVCSGSLCSSTALLLKPEYQSFRL
jgi:SH3 domain